MLNKPMSMTSVFMTRPHAVADCTTASGPWALLVPTAARAKGTGLSAFRIARDRFGSAPQATALLPINDGMTGVVNAGIRTWSPPV